MTESRSLIPAERIEQSILVIRGQKVMLSHHLASLYGVEPRTLIQAVKTQHRAVPGRLHVQTHLGRSGFLGICDRAVGFAPLKGIRSQFVILESGKHHRYRPYAFTEQGWPCYPACYAADRLWP